MALSIIESRAISKRIKTNLSTLNNGGVSIIESRKLSKAIKEDLALLNGTQAPENIIFLQEVIAGQHDSENVNDLAQKIIAAGDIVVASNDAIVAGAVDKWSSLDLAALWD
jgi:hypothetical protein